MMEKTREILAGGAMAALLAGCAPAGDAGAWSAVSAVSAGGGAAPVFAGSPAGAVALAWVSAPNAGKDGRLFVRPPGTDSSFELKDPLGSLSIYGEVPPKIAYGPNGTLYAAYLVTKIVPGMRWPQNALRFAQSRDDGRTWSAPGTVTKDKVFGSYDDHALLVAPDGTVHLSWLAEVGRDTSHTFVASSRDGGATWTRPVVVDGDRSCPCCRTSMAVAPDGALLVAWRKRWAGAGGEERDIAVARSMDGGRTFGAPTRVHADAWQVNYCPDAGPSLKVAPNGDVHIAWWTGKPGSAGTQYARSTNGGRTFGAPVALGLAQQSRASHIQLALGQGADSALVIATWDDGTLATPRIVARVSRDGGATFSAAVPLSAPESEVGYPVLALRADSVVIAWQERPQAVADAEKAKHAGMTMDTTDASMYVHAVGAMRVVSRSAALSRLGPR